MKSIKCATAIGVLASVCAFAQGLNPPTREDLVAVFIDPDLLADGTLRDWDDRAAKIVAAAETLLCNECMRTGRPGACGLRLRKRDAVQVMPVALRQQLQATVPASPVGTIDWRELSVLFRFGTANQRTIYLVRQLRSCGFAGHFGGCTNMLGGRISVLAIGAAPYGANWIPQQAGNLLHELGHTKVIEDRVGRGDTGYLMYSGSLRSTGTRLSPNECNSFFTAQ